MPLRRCTKDGKPGWKACDDCRCYTYTEGSSSSEKQAKRKAKRQLAAVKAGRESES